MKPAGYHISLMMKINQYSDTQTTMNEEWIRDSHKSAKFFKNILSDCDETEKMILIRTLDITGMFETSWLLFDHGCNTKYGYSK